MKGAGNGDEQTVTRARCRCVIALALLGSTCVGAGARRHRQLSRAAARPGRPGARRARARDLRHRVPVLPRRRSARRRAGRIEPAALGAGAERSRRRADAAGPAADRTRDRLSAAGLSGGRHRRRWPHTFTASSRWRPARVRRLRDRLSSSRCWSAMPPPARRYFAAEVREAVIRRRAISKASARGISDPAQLQNLWIAGGRGGRGAGPAAAVQAAPMTTRRETTVVVTLPTGQKIEGRLERIDDFMVTLTQADGTPRSFRRNGDVPKVDVRDPLEAHRKLLPVYTDKDIHDVTAIPGGCEMTLKTIRRCRTSLPCGAGSALARAEPDTWNRNRNPESACISILRRSRSRSPMSGRRLPATTPAAVTAP